MLFTAEDLGALDHALGVLEAQTPIDVNLDQSCLTLHSQEGPHAIVVHILAGGASDVLVVGAPSRAFRVMYSNWLTYIAGVFANAGCFHLGISKAAVGVFDGMEET